MGTEGKGGGESRRRPRRAPPSRQPGPPATVEETVSAVVRRLASRLSPGGAGPAEREPLRLDLAMEIRPSEGWRVVAEPPLAAQIEAALRETAARREAFRPGHVWCFRCERNDCPHSVPADPGSVFAGYSPTGQPLWEQLPQFLLTLGHPGVDILFEPKRTDLVAAFVGPERLTERQLPIYGKGSGTCAILGQVVLGHVRASDPSAGTERVAVTLQGIVTRDARGLPKVDLNVIARFPGDHHGLAALEGALGERLFDLVAVTRRRLRSLLPHHVSPGTPPPDPGKAAAILRDAARSVERLRRQGDRRTAHAQARGPQRRESAPALADALASPADALLWDERRQTVVVAGPRHRVHVFAPDGRHVTTFAMEGDEIARRISRGRWRPLPPEEAARFKAAVRGASGAAPPEA